MFAVKAFDLAAAAASCAAWPAAPALTVLNGVGAEEIIATARPQGGLIAGSVTASVETSGRAARWPGSTAAALLWRRRRRDVDTLTDELLAAFAAAGLRTRRSPIRLR